MKSFFPDAKKRLTSALDLPVEVLLDLPRMRFDGLNEFECENHKGIIEYSNTRLRIKTIVGEIRVNGNDLTLRDFGKGSLGVRGEIKSIEFD